MRGTIGNLEKSTLQRYQVCTNRSSDGKVMAPRSWAFELFLCVFPAKIPAKREMLPANRELYVVAGVAVFLKVSNLWTNSYRVGKNLCAKAAIWGEKRVRFPVRFSYFR
jgi:hypothetical protein